jgi:hypothetical protein
VAPLKLNAMLSMLAIIMMLATQRKYKDSSETPIKTFGD